MAVIYNSGYSYFYDRMMPNLPTLDGVSDHYYLMLQSQEEWEEDVIFLFVSEHPIQIEGGAIQLDPVGQGAVLAYDNGLDDAGPPYWEVYSEWEQEVSESSTRFEGYLDFCRCIWTSHSITDPDTGDTYEAPLTHTITYETEHGVAPEDKEVSDTICMHNMYGWNENEMFLPFDCYNPIDKIFHYGGSRYRMILKNQDTDNLFAVDFDPEALPYFWDNGNDTYKLYIPKGDDNVAFFYSVFAYDLLFPKVRSCEYFSVQGSEESMTYFHDGDGRIITNTEHGPGSDWFVLWMDTELADELSTYGKFSDAENLNNGPITPLVDYASADENYVHALNEEDLPVLSADGYVFKGWSGPESNQYGSTIYSVGDIIDSDVTLTAVWEEAPATPVDLTITYESAQGTAPEAKTVTVNKGESYTLTSDDLPTLTATGYTFTGWTMNGNPVSVGDTIEADTTLTAVWEKVVIHYDETSFLLGFASGLGCTAATKDGAEYNSWSWGYIVGNALIAATTFAGDDDPVGAMQSADGYTLQDMYGVYLIPKEDE